MQYASLYRPLAVTYLSYSADGTELVANTGGEHVYFYDKFRYTDTCQGHGYYSGGLVNDTGTYTTSLDALTHKLPLPSSPTQYPPHTPLSSSLDKPG